MDHSMAGHPRKITQANPIDLWEKVFADPRDKEAFDAITQRGVPEEELKMAVRNVWMATSFPRKYRVFRDRKGMESYLQRLFKRIDDFAEEIQKLHKDRLFRPKEWSSNFIAMNDVPPGPSCVLMQRDLSELPNLLRLQARYLRFQLRTIQKALAYRSHQHSETKATLELLDLVRNKTGRPLYSQVADLLTAAYQAFGIQKTVLPETLAIRYERKKRRKPE